MRFPLKPQFPRVRAIQQWYRTHFHASTRRSLYKRVSRRLELERLANRELLASDLNGCTSDGSWLVAFNASQSNAKPLNAFVAAHPQKGTFLDDGTLRSDSNGLKYFSDSDTVIPPPATAALPEKVDGNNSKGGSGGVAPTGLPPATLSVPVYHSNAAFTKKLYLDFDGFIAQGTTWNNQNYTGSYNTGNTINAPAFSTDADLTTYSASELSAIREIWAQVAEDYTLFQIDVTTQYPGDAIFTQGGQAIRAVMTTDVDATTGGRWFSGAGGVAYLTSFNWTDGSPVWIFYNNLGNGYPKYVGEATSHEVGHSFGLNHDGRISPSEGYYQGHGSGQTGWAPIMGVGYYRNLVQWSKGEYPSANNTEDDLAKIGTQVSPRVDDYGNNAATATTLTVGSTGAILTTGVVSTRTDVDAFKFFTQAGSVTVNVDPFELPSGKANLDVQMQILDSLGNVVSTVNDTTILNATKTITLARGTYTLLVDGVGKAAITGDAGYSDYDSIGFYSVSGTVVPDHAPLVGADAASVTGNEGQSISNTGTWSDSDVGDTVSLSASVGTVTKNANGTWSWTIAATDQVVSTNVTITADDGVGGTSNIVFAYSASNVAPALTVGASLVTGNVLSSLTNTGTWNDVPLDTVSLSASDGNVVKNNDGTWSWDWTPSAAFNAQPVTITGTDEDGGSSNISFDVTALVNVKSTNVYYKGSSFSSGGSNVNAALDTSKVIAKSGASSQTLSYANLINTTRGINGLVFDVAGLGSGLTVADLRMRMSPTGLFNEAANPPSGWVTAPAPSNVVPTPGNSTTPTRLRVEWTDNAIANRWLQLTVLANATTGLLNPVTFYIGHLQGEVNGQIVGGGFFATTQDQTAVLPLGTATVTSVRDLDKNGFVTTQDITAARLSIQALRSLRVITIPPAGSAGEGEGADESILAAPGPTTSIGATVLTSQLSDETGLTRSLVLPRWTELDYAVQPYNVTSNFANTASQSTTVVSTSAGAADVTVPDLVSLDAYFSRLSKSRSRLIG